MAGRGSFIESFPLFGFYLRDYDALFAEHVELLLRIRDQEVVTWEGGHRPPIDDRGVYPITLTVTDNQGAQTTSSPLTITVTAPGNQQPSAVVSGSAWSGAAPVTGALGSAGSSAPAGSATRSRKVSCADSSARA